MYQILIPVNSQSDTLETIRCVGLAELASDSTYGAYLTWFALYSVPTMSYVDYRQ